MNEPMTGAELMARYRETHGMSRLDSIVAPLMRYADRFATAHAMARRLGNTHGDEDAARQYREDLDKALREAITKAITDAALGFAALHGSSPSQNSHKEKP
jgi:hypothetical protein